MKVPFDKVINNSNNDSDTMTNNNNVKSAFGVHAESSPFNNL